MKPRRRVALVTAAAVTAVAAATAGAMAATSTQSVTVAGCLAGGRITGVSVKTVPTCAASATPVQWAGQAALPSPSATTVTPTPTVTTPTPTPTPTLTVTPTPTPTGTATGAACVTSAQNGTCGPYDYPGIPMSNGYDTYVTNQAVNMRRDHSHAVGD